MIETADFPGFDNVPDDGTFELEGLARVIELSDRTGLPTGQQEVTVIFELEDGEVVAYEVQGSSADLRFVEEDGSFELSSGGQYIVWNAPGESFAEIINPDALDGFNYQTYGVWLDRLSGSDPVAGAASFGLPTQPSDPALSGRGRAVYVGLADGWIVDGGVARPVFSDATIDTDFETFSFDTNNTFATTGGGGGFVPQPGFDLSGGGDVTGTTFTGLVQTQDRNGEGFVDGTFYGPGAPEVGGTFRVQIVGTGEYVGAFGAVRD